MPGSSPENEIPQDDQQVDTAIETKDAANTPAESSPAENQGEDKGDMLSAVKAALKPKENAPDSAEPDPKAGEEAAKPDAKEGAEAEADPDELTAEETALLRPKTRKRIENLLCDRRDRDNLIADLKPKAEQFEKIAGFVTEAGLSKDEVNDGFAVMRDLKREPFQAYQRLKPIVAQLAAMFGEGDLPDDLRQDVATGRITEQHARELVNARSTASLATTQAAERAEQERRNRAEQERVSNVNTVAAAVTEWERSKESSDPSWKMKQPRVMQLVELEIARRQRTDPNYFPTKDEALQFSQRALTEVEKDFQRLAPRPRAINPVTDAGSTRAVATPSSALEAAKQALANAG